MREAVTSSPLIRSDVLTIGPSLVESGNKTDTSGVSRSDVVPLPAGNDSIGASITTRVVFKTPPLQDHDRPPCCAVGLLGAEANRSPTPSRERAQTVTRLPAWNPPRRICRLLDRPIANAHWETACANSSASLPPSRGSPPVMRQLPARWKPEVHSGRERHHPPSVDAANPPPPAVLGGQDAGTTAATRPAIRRPCWPQGERYAPARHGREPLSRHRVGLTALRRTGQRMPYEPRRSSSVQCAAVHSAARAVAFPGSMRRQSSASSAQRSSYNCSPTVRNCRSSNAL